TRAAQAIGVYALLGAALTGAWGATAVRLRPRALQKRSVIVAALAVAYILLGFHINRIFFPSDTAPPSLVFTAVWTGLLAWLLLRLRRPEAEGASDDARVGRVVRAAAAGMVLVVLLALVLPGLWTRP